MPEEPAPIIFPADDPRQIARDQRAARYKKMHDEDVAHRAASGLPKPPESTPKPSDK